VCTPTVDKIFTQNTHHQAHRTTAEYAYLIKMPTATFYSYSELFILMYGEPLFAHGLFEAPVCVCTISLASIPVTIRYHACVAEFASEGIKSAVRRLRRPLGSHLCLRPGARTLTLATTGRASFTNSAVLGESDATLATGSHDHDQRVPPSVRFSGH